MSNELETALRAGPVHRHALLTLAGRSALDAHLRRHTLERVFPRVYARPWLTEYNDVRLQGALLSIGAPATLSHRTALRLHRLPAPPDTTIEVTIPHTRHLTMKPAGVQVHRARHRPETVQLGGLTVTAIERALVTTWPLLHGSQARAPFIEARVNEGPLRPASGPSSVDSRASRVVASFMISSTCWPRVVKVNSSSSVTAASSTSPVSTMRVGSLS